MQKGRIKRPRRIKENRVLELATETHRHSVAAEIRAGSRAIGCGKIEIVRSRVTIADIECRVRKQRGIAQEGDRVELDADACIQMVGELGVVIIHNDAGSISTLATQFQIHSTDTATKVGCEGCACRNIEVAVDIALDSTGRAEGTAGGRDAGNGVDIRATIADFEFDARRDEAIRAEAVTGSERAVVADIVISIEASASIGEIRVVHECKAAERADVEAAGIGNGNRLVLNSKIGSRGGRCEQREQARKLEEMFHIENLSESAPAVELKLVVGKPSVYANLFFSIGFRN